MATRMQQRRGTAAQWISTNAGDGPILNAGEIGFESDTGKFKIGDGVNHWIDLNYFLDAVDQGGSITDYVPLTQKDAVNGVASLDANKNVVVPGASIVVEGATDNAFETTLTVTNPTADRTITFPDTTGTVALTASPTFTGTLTAADVTITGNLAVTGELVILNTTSLSVDDKNIVLADIETPTDVTADGGGITLKGTTDKTFNWVDATDSWTSSEHLNLASGKVLKIAGTEVLSATTYTGKATTAGTADTATNGVVTTGTYSDPSWLTLTKAKVGLTNVDDTSDANKPVSTATQTALDLKAPLANPTFTGTVTLPANTITQSMMSDDSVGTNEIGGLAVTNEKLAGSIALSKLATDPLARANHTGSQTASTISDFNEAAQDAVGTILGTGLTYSDVSNTITVDSTNVQLRVANITDTEIGYLDGVTSAIQTQLDDKLSKTGGTMTGAITLSGAPTSDLHAATKLYVDNVTAGINFHESVHAASTTNLATIYNNGTSGVGATLTADTNRAFATLDGESVTIGQRVLIKDQTDAKQNGIYTLTTVGSVSVPWVLTRATDADNNPAGEIEYGDFCLVMNGTVNSGYGYINTSSANPIVIGTDNITYTAFNAGKTVAAGNGLSEATPGILSIDTTITANLSGAQTLTNKTISGSSNTISDINLASQVTGTLPVANGGTGITSLGTGVATFLGTPSSANLIAAVTDETGTGSLVFGTSPTIATPVLTLSATTSTASGRIAFDATNDKIIVGDGTSAIEFAPSTFLTSAQTGSYTLVLADKDKLVEMSNGSANTVTVPTNANVAFPIGTQINILQTNTGQTTVGGAGVTINGTPGLKLRAQWSSATLIKRGTDTWVLIGDLTA